jgi:hypothetical protein
VEAPDQEINIFSSLQQVIILKFSLETFLLKTFNSNGEQFSCCLVAVLTYSHTIFSSFLLLTIQHISTEHHLDSLKFKIPFMVKITLIFRITNTPISF